jgi:hypothetical protein
MLGFKSKTDTIVLSLSELVRRRRIEELKSLMGRIDLGVDLERSRRRPRSKARKVRAPGGSRKSP